MCKRSWKARFDWLDYAAKPPLEWNSGLQAKVLRTEDLVPLGLALLARNSIPGRVNYAVEQLTDNILTTYDSTTTVFNANQCPAGVLPTI
jgi:hypothetical protein